MRVEPLQKNKSTEKQHMQEETVLSQPPCLTDFYVSLSYSTFYWSLQTETKIL